MTFFADEDFRILDKLLLKAPDNFLKDSMNKESIFHMHIPKTGGSYVNKVFSSFKLGTPSPHGRCNPSVPLFPDPTDSIPGNLIYTDLDCFEESLKFCVIRNPFDWLTSYYFHQHGVSSVPWSGVAGVGGIRYYYDTFEKFVEAYCDEEAYWNLGLSEFRKFYPFQIFDESGICRADFIFKNGNKNELTSSCALLAAAFGIPPRVFKKIADEKINCSQAKTRNYKSYYTPRLVSMLENKWADILDVCGYNFYESIDEKIMISGNNLMRVENRLEKIA